MNRFYADTFTLCRNERRLVEALQTYHFQRAMRLTAEMYRVYRRYWRLRGVSLPWWFHERMN
jgi:arginyl-tRNA--protein-N-Asp/Glu arginylyltransferase